MWCAPNARGGLLATEHPSRKSKQEGGPERERSLWKLRLATQPSGADLALPASKATRRLARTPVRAPSSPLERNALVVAAWPPGERSEGRVLPFAERRSVATLRRSTATLRVAVCKGWEAFLECGGPCVFEAPGPGAWCVQNPRAPVHFRVQIIK